MSAFAWISDQSSIDGVAGTISLLVLVVGGIWLGWWIGRIERAESARIIARITVAELRVLDAVASASPDLQRRFREIGEEIARAKAAAGPRMSARPRPAVRRDGGEVRG